MAEMSESELEAFANDVESLGQVSETLYIKHDKLRFVLNGAISTSRLERMAPENVHIDVVFCPNDRFSIYLR